MDELGIIIVIHYAIYAILVVFAKPENVKSYGLHETVGPCDQVSPVNTASGQVSYLFIYGGGYHADTNPQMFSRK